MRCSMLLDHFQIGLTYTTYILRIQTPWGGIVVISAKLAQTL